MPPASSRARRVAPLVSASLLALALAAAPSVDARMAPAGAVLTKMPPPRHVRASAIRDRSAYENFAEVAAREEAAAAEDASEEEEDATFEEQTSSAGTDADEDPNAFPSDDTFNADDDRAERDELADLDAAADALREDWPAEPTDADAEAEAPEPAAPLGDDYANVEDALAVVTREEDDESNDDDDESDEGDDESDADDDESSDADDDESSNADDDESSDADDDESDADDDESSNADDDDELAPLLSSSSSSSSSSSTSAAASSLASLDPEDPVVWAATEEEMSVGGFRAHYVAASKALAAHADPTATLTRSRAAVKRYIADAVGVDDTSPGTHQTYLAVASVLLPLAPVAILAAATIRALSHASNARRAAQIANVYFAAFFAVLATSAVVAGAEPLASYQFVSGHAAYVRFQVLVALCYAPYLALTVGVAVADRWWPTTAGFVAAAAVGAHYYASTWHPAMLGAPPRAAMGIPSGAAAHAAYAIVFAALAATPPKEGREAFVAAECKEMGQGKAQD